ncbi:cellulose binding domain-containing protein [Microtetraspora fusca]|uniref:cellulose binding domain-containing protein n=1 Tax=Microtetraspora fusca TaxID=1997 RepID=UPI00082A07A6|nr:cellulose binding domain-containing protein [Microtetraspora fusca]
MSGGVRRFKILTILNKGGTVAAAADGSRFVWAPGDSGLQVVYSTGSAVSVRNLSWNGALAPGASTTFGFGAGWSGTNAAPSAVRCPAS